MTKTEKAKYIVANPGIPCTRLFLLHCDIDHLHECPVRRKGCGIPEKMLKAAKAYLAEHSESDPTGPRAQLEAKVAVEAIWTTVEKACFIAENEGTCIPFECNDSDGERCPFFSLNCGSANLRRADRAREWLAQNTRVKRAEYGKEHVPRPSDGFGVLPILKYGERLEFGKPIDVRPLPDAYLPDGTKVHKNPDGTTTFFVPLGTDTRSAVDITRETRGNVRAKLLGDE